MLKSVAVCGVMTTGIWGAAAQAAAESVEGQYLTGVRQVTR